MLLGSLKGKDCTKKQANATNSKITMLRQSRPFAKQGSMKMRSVPLNASTSFLKVAREDKELFHQSLLVLLSDFVTNWQISISSEGKQKKWMRSFNISHPTLIALHF